MCIFWTRPQGILTQLLWGSSLGLGFRVILHGPVWTGITGFRVQGAQGIKALLVVCKGCGILRLLGSELRALRVMQLRVEGSNGSCQSCGICKTYPLRQRLTCSLYFGACNGP